MHAARPHAARMKAGVIEIATAGEEVALIFGEEPPADASRSTSAKKRPDHFTLGGYWHSRM
jgi:hypothetical protein